MKVFVSGTAEIYVEGHFLLLERDRKWLRNIPEQERQSTCLKIYTLTLLKLSCVSNN